MSVTPITNHIAQALERLLEQYKHKPNIAAVLTIYAQQIQDLEDLMQPLFTERALANASGIQLDYVGSIVGQAREGLSDPEYRIQILVKIGKNLSEGEPERVIDIFKLLTQSEYVHLMNLNDASIALMTLNDFTSQDEVDELFRSMQEVVAAGVRIDAITVADPDLAFAYDGPGPAALGYDDGSGLVGGKYAKRYVYSPPFAYEGADETGAGYGAGHLDPIVGGVYQ